MSAHTLLQDSRFDLQDFHTRWMRARYAAIAAVLESDAAQADISEEDLVRRVRSERRDDLLRAVFDNSRLLGLGLARSLGLALDGGDFVDLFRTSGIRCFAGEWIARGDVRIMRRAGCGLTSGEAIICSYWREAADGLVMGAGEDERYVRYGNVLYGDVECEDVLFLERPDSRVRSLGPIPSRLAPELPKLQTLFRSIYRRELQFPGYADGVLYYVIKGGANGACGPSEKLLEMTLKRKLEVLEPGLRVQDASPRAIIGGSGE